MGKKKKKMMQCSYSRNGSVAKIEIRGEDRRIEYRYEFNINDKKAILSVLIAIEKFSGFSINEIIKEKLKGEWW